MRKLLLSLVFLVLGSVGAFAACPNPNPNLNAPPFYDGCQLPASALNRLIPFITHTGQLRENVSNAGVDSATCGAVASPCATPQQALTNGLQYTYASGSGLGLVIQLAAGVWDNQGIQCGGVPGGSVYGGIQSTAIYVIGAGSSLSKFTGAVSPATITAADGCILVLEGLSITNTNGSAVFPLHNGRIFPFTDVILGPTSLGTVHAETGGEVEFDGPITFNCDGTDLAALQAVLGGQIIFDEVGSVVTLTGGCNWSTGFADIESNSLLYVPSASVSFTGSATGKRFSIRDGVIETNNGTATFFPGDANGVILAGGKYLPQSSPVSATSTGTGTGNATTITGNNYVATVSIIAGTSASSSGTLVVNFSYNMPVAQACHADLYLGGNWNAGGTIHETSTSTSSVTFAWANNSVALTNATTYFVTVTCPTGGGGTG